MNWISNEWRILRKINVQMCAVRANVGVSNNIIGQTSNPIKSVACTAGPAVVLSMLDVTWCAYLSQSSMCPDALAAHRFSHPIQFWAQCKATTYVFDMFWIDFMRLDDFMQCARASNLCNWSKCHVLLCSVDMFCKNDLYERNVVCRFDGIFHFPQCRKFSSVTDRILFNGRRHTHSTHTHNRRQTQRVINGLWSTLRFTEVRVT